MVTAPTTINRRKRREQRKSYDVMKTIIGWFLVFGIWAQFVSAQESITVVVNEGSAPTNALLDARDNANRNRDNHTGEQAIATVTGLQPALDDRETIAELDARSAIDRARANHTGEQAIATVTGLRVDLDSRTKYEDTPIALAGLSSAVDAAVYATRGRRSVGDGGGNVYYYDSGSSAECDGLFVLDGIGGDNSPGDSAATYDGTGTGRFISVDQSVANVKQAGAVGDGVVDDTFRIQAAIDSQINSSFGGSVHLPKGSYRITSGLIIANATNTRINGFKFTGVAFKTTEIVWDGGVSGIAIEARAVKGLRLSGFYLRSTLERPDVGIWHHGGSSSSGGNAMFSDVQISGFQVGLKIASLVASESSVPGCSYYRMAITNNSTACIEILGNNSDGQSFYDLTTANAPIVVSGNGCRNVHLFSINHSNPALPNPNAYPDFVYMSLFGTLGNGGFSINGGRIEGGVRMLEVGNLTSVGNADDEQVTFTANNVWYGSTHEADHGPAPAILTAGNQGTYIFNSCHFQVPDGRFFFNNCARTNRHSSLFLTGTVVGTKDTEVFGELVHVTGNGSGGATGGVRVYIKGSGYTTPGAAEMSMTGQFRDREFQITPDNADKDAKAISAATKANPCSLTVTNHNYTTGDVISIIEVVGMTEINGRTYPITVVDPNTFTIPVDSTAFTAYDSAGTSTRPCFSAFKDDGNPQSFIATDATPSIATGSMFKTADTTTYTDFDDAVEGKRISILALHAAVVTNGTNIKTSTAANKTLVVDRLYNFVSIGGVWYEDATS